jgi:hypothetical protein
MKAAGALQTYLVLAKALRPLWHWVLKKRLERGKETPQSMLQ